MKLAFLFLSFTCYVIVTYSQECRQVMMTVCDDDGMTSRSEKGEKGEVGLPGKAGRAGMKGSKGDPGRVGRKGKSCDLGSLGGDIMRKLEELQKMLNNTLAPTSSVPLSTTSLPTTNVPLTTTPLPTTNVPLSITSLPTTSVPSTTTPLPKASCTTSSSNGKQRFSNGDEVYCEDGWTVFQRRFDGSVDFQVGWDAYVNGFGNKSGEFWLGLRKIHQLTEVEGCRLRVDLQDFEGNQAYAEYRSFSVANEDDLFRIRVSGYSGSADDDLRHHDYHVFSTFDRDNDPYSGANCATLKGRGQGGWWFHGSCYHCALNAAWGRSEGSYHNIVWQDWKGPRHALQGTTMKLRCD